MSFSEILSATLEADKAQYIGVKPSNPYYIKKILGKVQAPSCSKTFRIQAAKERQEKYKARNYYCPKVGMKVY